MELLNIILEPFPGHDDDFKHDIKFGVEELRKEHQRLVSTPSDRSVMSF